MPTSIVFYLLLRNKSLHTDLLEAFPVKMTITIVWDLNLTYMYL